MTGTSIMTGICTSPYPIEKIEILHTHTHTSQCEDSPSKR